ncbi:MAG: class I SAM-dependent methyltransferase [Bdellovibrionota bacterium]
MKDCYNCGSTGTVKPHDNLRMICSNCGAWIAILENTSDLAKLYSEKYFQGEEYIDYDRGADVHSMNFRRKLNILRKIQPDFKSVRLLEIGSASGEFLREATKHGITEAIGIEISEYAREKARARNLNVMDPFDKDLIQKIKEFRPNLIIMWDVWEHLPEPSQILKSYLSLVEGQCIVAVTTVDAGSAVAKKRQVKWRQFHPPTHINYPTRKSFEFLFASLDYKIVERHYFGYYRPLAEYLVAILGKKSWILNSHILFRIPLFLNLFDTQLVVARKS